MINILRKKNEKLIKTLSLIGDETSLKKQKLIKTLLAEDNCFFKLTMQDALTLLVNLKYTKDEALEIYKKLTSSTEFIKNK